MGAYLVGRNTHTPYESFETVYIDSDDIDFVDDPIYSKMGTPAPRAANGLPTHEPNFIDQFTAFIPSEALAIHIVAVAFLGKLTPSQDALLSGFILTLVALILWLGWLEAPADRRSWKRLAVGMIISVIAAAVYLAALPDSIAHELPMYTPTIGGLVVLLAAVLLPRIASVTGIQVRR